MSLRTHWTRLIVLYSLCLLGLGLQYPALLCSWNLNMAWIFVTHASGNDTYMRVGRAEAHFRRALELERDRPAGWTGLAYLALLREDREGVETAFEEALSIDHSQPLANRELAKIRRSEGNFSEAAAHYCAAGDAYSLVNLADGLATSQPKEALRMYKDAIALLPGSRLPHTQLGKLLRHQGRLDDALIEFKRALDADPTYGWSWYHLASTCLEDGRLEECVESIRSARSRFPMDAELTAALLRLEVRARHAYPGNYPRRRRD